MLQFRPAQGPLNRLANELAPQAAGLMVVHYQGIHDQLTGHAKCQLPTSHLSAIYNGRKAEWSPGNRYGFPSHHVVDDFPAAEEGYGVCAMVAVDGHANYIFVIRHLRISFIPGQKRR